jgi:CDP-diglyceride synthetase
MCGTPFWWIVAAIACAYFAYSAYTQVREQDFDFHHGWWTVLTWAVWVLLLTGLLSETRCWRERIFFGLLWLNSALGFVLAAWSDASWIMVRTGRQLSLALWVLSALASLLTVTRSAPATPKSEG